MTKPNHSRPTIKSEYSNQSSSIQPRIQTAGFKCDLCNSEFQLKNNLIQHVTESHKVSIDIVKTEEASEFIDHRNSNSDEGEIQSNLNGETPKSQNDFTSRQQTNSDERQFQCNICKKTFKTHGNLIVHIR
eukprot:15849_1